MITTIILVLLGIALVFVVMQMIRASKQKGSTVTPMRPQAASINAGSGPAVDLWNARVGDVVSIHGAAEDFSDLDFNVEQRNTYEAMNRRWIGLSGNFRGRRVSLEVDRARTTEVMGILNERPLTLPDVGLTEDQLADLDSRQDPSAFIQFESKRWHYTSSRELAWSGDEGEPKGLYRWIFTEKDGSRMLCVEKWEGDPFQVQLAQKLNPQDITVYRAA